MKTETFGRIQEQISEELRCSEGFSPAREFSQTLSRFSPGYEATENMFDFFYKNIFHLNKEIDDIQIACVYFNFFHETVNSQNLERPNLMVHVIFVLHSAMKHILVDQSKRTCTIQSIL